MAAGPRARPIVFLFHVDLPNFALCLTAFLLQEGRKARQVALRLSTDSGLSVLYCVVRSWAHLNSDVAACCK